MNPWITIWKQPRVAIAQIVSENPNRGVWLLAWIYGFLSLLNVEQSLNLGMQVHFIGILLLAILLAPFWGMIIFGIWSWIVLMVGKVLKGQGAFSHVRAAFAWSCVPLTINIALWVLLLAILGRSLFDMSRLSGVGLGLIMVVLITKLAVIIWSLIIYINALAEVQKFSITRAIVNIVVSWIVIGVVIALIWVGLFNPLTLRVQ